MSKQKRYLFITVVEWGADRPKQDIHTVDKLRKNGWNLPTPNDFQDALASGMGGFVDKVARYWVKVTKGNSDDVGALMPADPHSWHYCNFTTQNRFRLIRRVHIQSITTRTRRKIKKVKLFKK